ncbi:hypothetical protein M0804_008986 [Polistes exclamans]|nr:hypothetical protein M0804_008986 [Polistes exclamans]
MRRELASAENNRVFLIQGRETSEIQDFTGPVAACSAYHPILERVNELQQNYRNLLSTIYRELDQHASSSQPILGHE